MIESFGRCSGTAKRQRCNRWFFAEQKIPVNLWKYEHRMQVQLGVSVGGAHCSLKTGSGIWGLEAGNWERKRVLRKGRRARGGVGGRAVGAQGEMLAWKQRTLSTGKG